MLRTLLLLGAAGAAAALETGVVSVGVSTFAASFANDYQQPVVIAGIPSCVAFRLSQRLVCAEAA